MTGEEIKNRRAALGMTQTELANALGITETAIRHWESGRRSPVTPQMLDMALSWLETQQPKSDRHKTTMARINATIENSRAALSKK